MTLRYGHCFLIESLSLSLALSLARSLALSLSRSRAPSLSLSLARALSLFFSLSLCRVATGAPRACCFVLPYHLAFERAMPRGDVTGSSRESVCSEPGWVADASAVMSTSRRPPPMSGPISSIVTAPPPELASVNVDQRRGLTGYVSHTLTQSVKCALDSAETAHA